MRSSEAAEGVAEGGFGDAVGVEQDGFDVAAFAARLADRVAEVLPRQQLLFQQMIKFGRPPLHQLRLIPQCHPKRLSDVRGKPFFLRREAVSAPLVDQEEHAHQVFPLNEDGDGKHLAAAEATTLIPRRIEGQTRINRC